MTLPNFDNLSRRQQKAMLIAAQVRVALEQFHAASEPDAFISDEQMAKLNPVIRQAVFDALQIVEDTSGSGRSQRGTQNLLGQIQPYWEPPVERPRDPRFDVFDD